MLSIIWRFAGCEFDDLRRELRVDGVAVDVEVKPLDVLHQLLLHSGEVVTKDELLDSVWSGVETVEGSLATAVSKLRKALGPHRDVVVTLPLVGYVLGAPVHQSMAAPAERPEFTLEEGEPVPGRDQWRLVRRLAQSPARAVWLAEHPKTGSLRVFKFALDDSGLNGLKREATLARLIQASLGDRADFLRVLEWNFERHPYFLESEYAGSNLAEWAESQGGLGNVPLATRLRLLEETARAVQAAHDLAIIHKDLKPGNVMVAQPDGQLPQIKLGDLGSATLIEPARLGAFGITNMGFTHQDEISGPGAVSGTIMYVAPEVFTGQWPNRASDVYALGLLLYQMVVGDFRRPLALEWEREIDDPLLRDDIARAAAGDPARRLSSAGELADRLASLDRRRAAAAREPAAILDAGEESARERTSVRATRWPVWARLSIAIGVVAVLVVAAGALLSRSQSAPKTVPLRTVAVLPLNNAGGEADLDSLGLALADEVATILVHTRGLGVRPVSPISPKHRTSDSVADARATGRAMNVDSVVAGRFQRVQGRLNVTLSAIDVAGGQLLWQETLGAPTGSMIAMQVQLALRIRGGLAPALGGTAPPGGPEPVSEEGYALFLRSASVPNDAVANRSGIEMLQRSVALDPGFAPAWLALSKRYYAEARYGNGDKTMLARSEETADRALALDPDSVAAAANLSISRVERGELLPALQRAEAMARRRPDSVDAHFSLSYVLRFAGLLKESAVHCETAFLLDPRNNTSGLRSCSVVFLLLDDYPRMTNYLHLDDGSEFERAMLAHAYVRSGEKRKALQLDPLPGPQWNSYRMLLACAAGAPKPVIDRMATVIEPSDDPETNYFAAGHLAYCGQTAPSLRLLRRAIEGNYCSFPTLDRDPFFSSLRRQPEFTAIREAAMACQNRFLAGRRQLQASR